jgi:hypothetical protein
MLVGRKTLAKTESMSCEERSKHTTKSSHIICSKETNSESMPKMEQLSLW